MVQAATATKDKPASPKLGKISVKQVPISRLKPSERNARTHSKKQIEKIAGSITKFGWTAPIVIDAEFQVLAGHGRLAAAEFLEMTKVPCITVEGLTEQQRREYILADNRIAEAAGWDSKLLGLELSELRLEGADLKALGFTAPELRKFAPAPKGSTDPEEPDDEEEPVPELAVPVTQLGEMWLLGTHRLLCGDATAKDDVERVLEGGVPVRITVTDPPYGVNYDPAWREKAADDGFIEGAGRSNGEVKNDDRADWRTAFALFPGDVAYVWHGGLAAGVFQTGIEEAGFEIRAQNIWNKPVMAIGRGAYHWKHEPCWYGVRKGTTAHWRGGRSQTTVWDISNVRRQSGAEGEDTATNHSTQKPVECMARPIRNHTDPGEGVFDPFLGSGTTLIAAQQNGRVCYAIELDPGYVDVAVRRWQNLTRLEAVAAVGGKTFDEVAAEWASAR